MNNLLKYLSFVVFVLYAHHTLVAQSAINIGGENTAVYIYRVAEDSLHHYFEDELKLRVSRGNFTFGMTFLGQLPKYDQTAPIENLHQNDIYTEWVERYVELDFDDFRIRAGTVEEAFGAGLVMRLYQDTETDQDTRVEGAMAKYFYKSLRLSGVYGALREDNADIGVNKKDVVLGADVEFKLHSVLSVGGSAVQYQQITGIYRDKYAQNDVFGGRMSLTADLFDLKAEYSALEPGSNNPLGKHGSAIYANTNIYMGVFTFTTGYKRYSRYDLPIFDLPRLNHFDELLTTMEYVDTDFEEGLMGEVKYIPDSVNELTLQYAESWNKDFSVGHSNIFAEYKRDLSSSSMTLEYEHIERLVKDAQFWNKELRPTVTFDFYDLSVPLLTKFRWVYTAEEHGEKANYYHKPYLQVDSKFGDKLSVSLFGQYQFSGSDDLWKNSPALGVEAVTGIAKHTEIKLFVGTEKGGKVCRNGVCRVQAPFEGLKLSINTKF